MSTTRNTARNTAKNTVAIDLRQFERALDMSHRHPRGQGFRVLSRIARVQADDAHPSGSAEYSPRHRRDVPADLALRYPIAG